MELKAQSDLRYARLTNSSRIAFVSRLRSSGYLDLAADGLMDREELRGKLAELDLQRGELEEALRAARNRQQSIEELEQAWLAASAFLGLHGPTYAAAGPEDRRRIYQALRLQATTEKDGTVILTGIFDPAIRLIDLVTGPPPDLSAPLPKPPVGTRVVVASENTSPPASHPPRPPPR